MEQAKAIYGELPVADILIDDGHNPRTDFEESALLDLGNSFTSDTQLMPVIINRRMLRLRNAKSSGVP